MRSNFLHTDKTTVIFSSKACRQADTYSVGNIVGRLGERTELEIIIQCEQEEDYVFWGKKSVKKEEIG